MRRIYIDINNPTNTEKKVWIRKWNGARSVIIKRSKGWFVDPFLFPIRRIIANAKFDNAFFDVRRTNALGQRNN